MILIIIEVTNVGAGGLNWGKFLLFQLTDELEYKSRLKVDDPEVRAVQERYPLLRLIGYSPSNVFVFDLQTREGAAFIPRKDASAKIDLEEKRIWVCPMYEPFLKWLYEQDCRDITKLPALVELDAESALRGYRREGKERKPGREPS